MSLGVGSCASFFGGARCGVAGAGGFLNDGPATGGFKGFMGVAGFGRTAESEGTSNGWWGVRNETPSSAKFGAILKDLVVSGGSRVRVLIHGVTARDGPALALAIDSMRPSNCLASRSRALAFRLFGALLVVSLGLIRK